MPAMRLENELEALRKRLHQKPRTFARRLFPDMGRGLAYKKYASVLKGTDVFPPDRVVITLAFMERRSAELAAKR